MSKLAELQQNYQDVCSRYDELYGGVEYQDLPEDGLKLLIKKLEASLKIKEITLDERKFNRYHKPVTAHRISLIYDRIENLKFLKSKVKA